MDLFVFMVSIAIVVEAIAAILFRIDTNKRKRG